MTSISEEATPTRGLLRPRATRKLRGLPFLVPYLPFLIGLGIVPMLMALELAVTNFDGSWSGLGNFVTTYNDYRFWPAAENVLMYTGIWMASLVIFVVGLTLLLHARANKVSATFRFLFYIPGALAGAASVLVWLFMLSPDVSPWGFALKGVFGIHLFAEVPLPQHLPYIFAIIAFWTGAGGWIVVMYGALNTIPPDIEEAARLDGAGPIQIAFRVKLPMIQKWIGYMLILTFATGTQVFVEPWLMNIATLNGINPDWSMNQYAYQMAFAYYQFNRAAAISVDLLLVGLLAAAIIITRTKLFSTD